jgi:eukaryotic-like serine/threonine-protein kinase
MELDTAVVDGWSRLFTYLLIASVVAVVIAIPFVGLLIALPGVIVLRAGDLKFRRRDDRVGLLRLLFGPFVAPFALLGGLVGTVLTVPYAAVFAVGIPLGCMALAAFGVRPDPLTCVAWGLGAAVYILLAGPGVHAPRNQLTRLFAALAARPWRIGLVGVVLCLTATAGVVAAIGLRPSFAPTYQLMDSLTVHLTRLQDSIHQHTA